MGREVRGSGASGRLWPRCVLLLLASSPLFSSPRGSAPSAALPAFAEDTDAPLSLRPGPPAFSPRRLKPKKAPKNAKDKKTPNAKRGKNPAQGGGKGRKSKAKGGKNNGVGKGRKSKAKGSKKGGKSPKDRKKTKRGKKGRKWKAKGRKKSEASGVPSPPPSDEPSPSLSPTPTSSPSGHPSPAPGPEPSPRSSDSPSPSPTGLPSLHPGQDTTASPAGPPQESPSPIDWDYDLLFDLSPLNSLLVHSTAKDETDAPPGSSASFYGIKDSMTGIASGVTHAEVVDGDGRHWTVVFEEGWSGRPVAIWGEDGDVVRIEYRDLGGGEEDATFTFVSADGASNPQEKVTVALPSSGEGEDGRQGRGLGLGADEGAKREADEVDNVSATVARPFPPAERDLASTKTTTVSVISCDEFGLPVDANGIEVLMDVQEYRNGALSASYKVRGEAVAPGEYEIPINLPDTQVVPASANTLCEKVSLAVDVVCAAVNGQTLLSAALICAQLRLPWAFAFCEIAFAAVLFTCATVGRGGGPVFSPSVISLLCSGTTVEWGYDRIYMVPTARVPGLPESEGTGEPYSGSPFSIPDGFFVDVATDPRFVEISVDVNPVAGQGYNVYAMATCVPGKTISLLVSGADGYSDNVECVAEEGLGTKSCTLSVPGANAYIRDKLEATIGGTDAMGRGQLFFRPRTDGSPIPVTERTRAGGPSNPDLSVLWTNIGDVLYGDFDPRDGYVGLDWRIALSNDGRTMAVAAPFIDHFPTGGDRLRNAGLVKVYRRSGNDDGSPWVPLGNLMRGNTDDNLGFQLALDNGIDPVNGAPTTFLAVTGGRQPPDFFGWVRVYYLTAGSNPVWNPLGPAIEGSVDYPRMGESIFLANGGRTLATGSATCKISWYVVGCVLVFDYSETAAGGSQWVLRDRVLRGEQEDRLGRHVALSADGNAVAASADQGFDPGSGGYGNYVRAFRWNGSASQWDPMGQKLQLGPSGGHWYVERSVSLSADGATMVAIGGRNLPHSYLRAFRYDSSADAWSPLGQDIVNPGATNVVGLSADGTTICEGDESADGEGTNSGQIRVFRLVDGYWVQQGYAIDGDDRWANLGQHCVVSADGTVVVGAGSLQYGGVHVFRAETI